MKKSVVAVLVLLGLGGVVQGQQYPARPVRLIVATVPGGGTDTIARILGGKLGEQFVVDSRGGRTQG